VNKTQELEEACRFLHMPCDESMGIYIAKDWTDYEHTTASIYALHKRLQDDGLELKPGTGLSFFVPYASEHGTALSASLYELISSRFLARCHVGLEEKSSCALVQSLQSAGSTPMLSMLGAETDGTDRRYTEGRAASVLIVAPASILRYAKTKVSFL